MPEFQESLIAEAPPEEVWKLLYDPARFPEWWQGVGTVDSPDAAADGHYTMYPEGYPDFPMPQLLTSGTDGRSVTVSCLVSDLRFEWRLRPVEADRGTHPAVRTEISAHVVVPEAEAHRVAAQTEAIHASLLRLAALAG